jgi:type IX secretion system PorP/SprF family membrane protein
VFRGIITLLIIVIFIGKSKAQDAHFSQFYAAPTFMSPSLAGATGGTRIISNYRNQWPGVKDAYRTFSLSADLYINKYKSGLGVLLVSDQAGSASLSTTNFGLQYSYRVKIGNSLQFIPGLQFTLGQKSIDVMKLKFPDELYTGGSSGADALFADPKVGYVDFSLSGFIYSRSTWFGVVVDHLLEPEYSFLGEETHIPLKIVAFGGMNIWKERASRIETPRRASFVYRFQNQGGFNQIDLGAYWYNRMLEFGVWYRGLPAFNKSNDFIDSESVVFLVGVIQGPIKLGYSYDIQLSGLARSGGGAHEISMIFEMGEIFGCGTKYLDCFTKRAGHKFNKKQPRKIEIY